MDGEDDSNAGAADTGAQEGQAPVKVIDTPLDASTTDQAAPADPDALPDAVARHQPPAESPLREFADHMDRERQAFKDWVRKEIGLLMQNKSHDERVAENP